MFQCVGANKQHTPCQKPYANKVVFYCDQPFQVGWVGAVVSCSIGKKPFSVGLVAQLFQPLSKWVEAVVKALVAAAVVFTRPKDCYLCGTCVINSEHGEHPPCLPRESTDRKVTP